MSFYYYWQISSAQSLIDHFMITEWHQIDRATDSEQFSWDTLLQTGECIFFREISYYTMNSKLCVCTRVRESSSKSSYFHREISDNPNEELLLRRKGRSQEDSQSSGSGLLINLLRQQMYQQNIYIIY